MRLLFRVDASAHIGTGHLMRCLALGQACQELGGDPGFALALCTPSLEERLQAEGMLTAALKAKAGSPEDAQKTIDLAQRLEAAWLVLDGYHFGTQYQHILKDAGLSLVFIDDIGHANHYVADIIINQNLHAHPGLYSSKEPHTVVLLGPQYALLRREFRKSQKFSRQIPPVAHKVLVTLGGSDPNNATQKVIQALSNIDKVNLEGMIVVGGGNPNYQELEQAAAASPCNLRLVRDIRNMTEPMAWADIAVSAGGSTCWELAFMGLPCLTLILAENQEPIGKELDNCGVVRNLGWADQISVAQITESIISLSLTPEDRATMSRKGRKLVDGKGCERILARILGSHDKVCH